MTRVLRPLAVAATALALAAAPVSAAPDAASPDTATLVSSDAASIEPTTAGTGVAAAPDTAQTIDEPRLLIRWEPSADAAARRRTLADLDLPAGTSSTFAASAVRLDGRTQAYGPVGLGSAELARLAATLEDEPTVQVAEADQRVEVAISQVGAEPDGIDAAPPPDDPHFGQQWGLDNTGQIINDGLGAQVPVPGVDIDLLEAWNTTHGDAGVRVAVIDTAVDTGHPDLLDAIEIEERTYESGAAALPGDHGTAVAGVLGARSEDGIGVAGVAPRASIISVAAFESIAGGTGTTTVSAIVVALEVARSAGADIINASWTSPVDSDLLRTAVAEAGVPVVAAAGNEGLTLSAESTVFPAGYDVPNLVSVTAIGPAGGLPAFANRGAEMVDVAAPGVDVLAPVVGGGYGYASGTSFAAPHVTGALALALSAAPYATVRELVDAVSWTSTPQPELAGVTRSGGRLDAGALVRGIQRPICRPDLLEPADFTDVATTNVHAAGIDCLAARGVTTGRLDGTYLPAAEVSRAQLAAFLARLIDTALDLPAAPASGFPDVPSDHVHAASIDRLASLDIAHAGQDGFFRPDAPVTRGQAAALLVRTYDLLTGDPDPPSRTWFLDTPGTTHADAINRGRDLGILSGVARVRFDPGGTLRRDQMASVFARAMDALGRKGVTLG